MPPRSAPAPYAPTSNPAPAFDRSNSSAYIGTSGVSAVKSSASTKMIALTRMRRRRIRARIGVGLPVQRKCTEPVASSSDLPTDHRRSDNHSESHQPQTLRSRCIADSMRSSRRRVKGARTRNRRNFRERLSRCCPQRAVCSAGNTRTRKCTEPVAPSSGFPTDLRRSGCRSESHQPRTLRTRCIADSRGHSTRPSRHPEANFSQFAIFSFRTGSSCNRALSVLPPKRKKNGRARRPGRKDSPSRERFRPPSRRTFRFRVVLLGGLRPTGAPCSAQAGIYDKGPVRSRGSRAETSRKLRRISRSSPGRSRTPGASRGA